MKQLHIATQLSVPIDVVTEKLAWIGVTGSGKSYGASKLAEEMWHAHAQFVVLDPVGVWYGLRLAKDGKAAGIPIPVFGGLHGDVPLEATAGALVADLIVDKDLSAVIDVSQFDTDADKARFVSAFADRLYHRRKRAPAAMHVFLEEAQEFVPQNPQPGEQMMLHRLHRMQKLGRNFGIGTSIITQRPQETSKKALNQAQTVFVFRLTGSQERKAIEAWVNEHGLEENLLDGLPKMETGNCHVWSPAWLKVFKIIRISAKATFDASATPKVGVRAAARELAPIDLERIRKDMAATIEKAKAEDPTALRAKIAQLQKELKHAQYVATLPDAKPKIERVEIPIIKPAETKRLEVTICRAEGMLTKTREALLEMTKVVEKASNHMFKVSPKPLGDFRGVHIPLKNISAYSTVVIASKKAWDDHERSRPKESFKPIKTFNGDEKREMREARKAIVAGLSEHMPQKYARAAIGDFDLSGPQQKILAALVFLQSIEVFEPSKNQVALFVGVSPNSGSYANNLGALRSAGFVSYPNAGDLAITPEGMKVAPSVNIPTNSGELHAAVMAKLSRPQQAILQEVLTAYPNPVTKEWIAEQIGVSAGSGSYANNLGHLRTLGAITYPSAGAARAADIMFIEGK